MDVQAFLAHHGVLGMKWGIRKDRGSGSSPKSGSTDKRTISTKTASEIASSKKKLEDISDRDLQTLLNRLNMERQLRDFTKTDRTIGQKITSKIIEASGKGLLKTYERVMSDVSYKYATNYLKKKGLA